MTSIKPSGLLCVLRRWASSLTLRQKRNNVILMGSPGSGKTTIGKLLGERLNRPVVDIDNDVLEKCWGMPVARKLSEVGSEKFLEVEGQTFLSFDAADSIISLTGSNPMHPIAVEHMKKLGTVVFIDVASSDILRRLEQMKVSRIVGQNDGVSMSDILSYRQQFYEGNYDLRVLCAEFEKPESIVDKIVDKLDVYERQEGYTSTRGESTRYTTFCDVVLDGLAKDGGLYVPKRDVPTLSHSQWQRLVPLSYTQRALHALEQWIHPQHYHPTQLLKAIEQAYTPAAFESPTIVPVRHLYDNIYIMELFHGPTASFKDLALQLMPKFFQCAVNYAKDKGQIDKHNKFLILVATSGDTGSAVLHGFKQLITTDSEPEVKVMVLYPEQGVSLVQKRQMQSMHGHGLHVVGVHSDFDFCQTAIKNIFNDVIFSKELCTRFHVVLSAANSINWGRLLPQVVYHASAYLDLIKTNVIAMGDPVDLCIPTGNFGNILAAYYAKRMGIPFHRLICASNMNNVLTEFINSGTYNLTHRKLHVTSSPAIDILKSSNLERYLYDISDGDCDLIKWCYDSLNQSQKFTVPAKLLRRIQEDFIADWCTEEASLASVADVFKKSGYIMDTHTAVAMSISNRLQTDRPMLVAGTAHFAKFAPDVLRALQPASFESKYNDVEPLQLLEEFDGFKHQPPRHTELFNSLTLPILHERVCKPDRDSVKEEVIEFLSSQN